MSPRSPLRKPPRAKPCFWGFRFFVPTQPVVLRLCSRFSFQFYKTPELYGASPCETHFAKGFIFFCSWHLPTMCLYIEKYEYLYSIAVLLSLLTSLSTLRIPSTIFVGFLKKNIFPNQSAIYFGVQCYFFSDGQSISYSRIIFRISQLFQVNVTPIFIIN